MTLIIQHEKSTSPGSLIEWLDKNQKSYKVCELFNGDQVPVELDFDALVICGGSMNVDQESKFSWMTSEKKLIRDAIANQKKVLGLCLGAQLIAESLGAKVGPMNFSEVGWHNIDILQDSKYSEIQACVKVFQYHSYCFHDVPHSKNVATNSIWSHQGFSVEDHVLAFQFHPESTREWVTMCALEKELPTGKYCQNSNDILAQIENQKKLQNWFFKVLDSFFIGRT